MTHKHPNVVHRESLSRLDRAALYLTSKVGTMWCALLFTVLAAVSAPAAFGSGSTIIIIAWITQTFLQLVLLPIILVGQNLQNRHNELRADFEYKAVMEILKKVS